MLRRVTVATLKKASKKALVASLQGLAHIGGAATEQQLVEWTGMSATTVRHALRILTHCHLVENGGDATARLATPLPHPLSEVAAVNSLATAMAQTDSFVELAALLDAGHSADDSARRSAMVVPNLEDADSAATILSVASDLGLLARTADGYSVADALERQAIVFLASDLGPGAAQLALRETMGPGAYGRLERNERDRLGQALNNVVASPEKACEDAGKAVENYLRLVARDASVDVSACNGLAQVADSLAAKGVGIIRPQHRVLAHEIAMCRNSSGHDRDKVTLTSWDKTPAFARANVLLAARLIASVDAWRQENRQIL